MKYKVLEDFETYEEVEQDVINLYKSKIPEKLLDIWKEYGFGYVPLLGLGGSEKVENKKKVKIKEHIELIMQMVGKIEQEKYQ